MLQSIRFTYLYSCILACNIKCTYVSLLEKYVYQWGGLMWCSGWSRVSNQKVVGSTLCPWARWVSMYLCFMFVLWLLFTLCLLYSKMVRHRPLRSVICNTHTPYFIYILFYYILHISTSQRFDSYALNLLFCYAI